MPHNLPPEGLRKRGIESVEHLGSGGRCIDGALLFDFFEAEIQECLAELGGSDAAANDIEIAHA